MLKLLFLTRRNADLEPLLSAQREELLWRLHSTTAAIHFTEAMLTDPAFAKK
jgi:hypothetical protein